MIFGRLRRSPAATAAAAAFVTVSALLPTLVVAAPAPDGVISRGHVPDSLHGSNFSYPWPVQIFSFTSQLQSLDMAFMDISPSSCPVRPPPTALLLHGKNFCAPTWEATIRALLHRGYRVIAPDQVGFCKSSKPAAYQFSLHQLAQNTHALLNALAVDRVTVIGHSLGGSLAARFALQYPDRVERLVMVGPVGLEDYIQKGVPYISIDQTIKTEAASNYHSIRAYEEKFYYANRWRPAYETWVNMLVDIYHGPQREAFIRNQAQIVDMVLTSPLSSNLPNLRPRTLLVVGAKDRTAIGAQWSPPEIARTLGRFDLLGPEIARQIPNATLHLFPDLGHAPHISDPDRFHTVLLDWLSSR